MLDAAHAKYALAWTLSLPELNVVALLEPANT